jgi:hypothetical protein
MNVLLRGTLILSLAWVSAWAQEAKKQDDVLQKKDGGIMVGRVVKLEADVVEFLLNGEKESRRISLRELMPYSVYRIRLDRTDKASGQARMELGEFCMSNNLYSAAVREFEEAGRLDKSLEEKAKKRRDEAHNEDGRAKFEDVKKLHLRKEYQEAINIIRTLTSSYGDTPYAAEAKAEETKMAEEIAKENEAKKQQADQKAAQVQAQKAAAKDDMAKDLLVKTVEMLEDATRAWGEGLDAEPKNLTKADRAWKAAEGILSAAKRNVESLLKLNDVAVLQKAKELERQVDMLLVRVYWRLGRMWAVELNYPDAHMWLNKAMKVPHDEQMDHLINDLLLSISQTKIRERAAGRGY